MRRSIVLTASLFLGCTKSNPRSCSDGSCTDPSLPFCDVDGALAGTPKVCIAVACQPNEFAACRGDRAITCNADGSNYDLVSCPLGCSDAAMGCRVCMPNQTVCADGKVQSCDASGNVTSSQACSLGCFESEPRCRDLDPSNGLATYLDMVTSPRDLDLSAGGTIDVDTGSVTSPGMVVPVDTFLIVPTGAAPGLRVIVANRVTLGNVGLVTQSRGPGPALAIVASGDIRVLGDVDVDVAGAFDTAACVGGPGVQRRNSGTPVKQLSAGSGGGANATNGARGGGIDTQLAGGAGGFATGTKALVPLRGGCTSGGVDAEGGLVSSEAFGGGAIQLSSRTRIAIDGAVHAEGYPGGPQQGDNGSFLIFGGGGGGGILLEAPVVTLGPNAKLLATGGVGGGMCSASTTYCGAGGAGATVNMAAAAGGDSLYQTTGAATSYGGGGGGGLGRIRVNTPTATYTKSSGSIEDGDISTGTLGTR